MTSTQLAAIAAVCLFLAFIGWLIIVWCDEVSSTDTAHLTPEMRAWLYANREQLLNTGFVAFCLIILKSFQP